MSFSVGGEVPEQRDVDEGAKKRFGFTQGRLKDWAGRKGRSVPTKGLTKKGWTMLTCSGLCTHMFHGIGVCIYKTVIEVQSSMQGKCIDTSYLFKTSANMEADAKLALRHHP